MVSRWFSSILSLVNAKEEVAKERKEIDESGGCVGCAAGGKLRPKAAATHTTLTQTAKCNVDV